VKELVGSVRGYLDSDTGNDDCHIEAMNESIVDVLNKARGIPAERTETRREQ
jgi:hypothetical protein